MREPRPRRADHAGEPQLPDGLTESRRGSVAAPPGRGGHAADVAAAASGRGGRSRLPRPASRGAGGRQPGTAGVGPSSEADAIRPQPTSQIRIDVGRGASGGRRAVARAPRPLQSPPAHGRRPPGRPVTRLARGVAPHAAGGSTALHRARVRGGSGPWTSGSPAGGRGSSRPHRRLPATADDAGKGALAARARRRFRSLSADPSSPGLRILTLCARSARRRSVKNSRRRAMVAMGTAHLGT